MKKHHDSSKKQLFSKQKSDSKKSFNLKEKFRQFREWQQRPYQPMPMTYEEHECANCHDHFQGNYCPRCGQSEKLGRYSFKVAMANFINAVGLGEKGMFRTMRDLILRPSYLIRDYIGGMQASYFSPIKLYFLLAAISLFVTHGVNIKGTNPSDKKEKMEAASESKVDPVSVYTDETNNTAEDVAEFSEQTPSIETQQQESDTSSIHFTENQKQKMVIRFSFFTDFIKKFSERAPNILAMLVILLISGGLYLFFRHSPNVPDMRYSEFFIALLYSVNMYSIYSIVFSFFCLPTLASLSILLILAPIKKFSGFGWCRTIMKFTVASILALLVLVLGVMIIIVLLLLSVKVI